MPSVEFRLYLVSDRGQTGGRPLNDLVALASQAGLPAIQVRERDLPTRQLEPETVTAEEEKIKDVVETVEDEDETESELKSVIMMESSDLIGSGGDEDVMLPPAISNQTNLQPRMTESENIPPTEKPLVSSRFGHRKSVKASPEGTTARSLS